MNIKKIVIAIVVLLLILGTFIILTKQNNQNMNEETQQVKKNPIAVFETSMGNIEIELLVSESPKTVENFIKLAKDGFYDGTRFHRIIKDFMIQGGDPLSKEESQRSVWGTGGPGYKFDDEPNDVVLIQGVIAMANSGPNTNGSQFFIITADKTPWLQGVHTGFGKVTVGMDIVLKIQEVEITPGDQPVEDIILQKVIIK